LIAVVGAEARLETIVQAKSVGLQICASLSIQTFSDLEAHSTVRTFVARVTRGPAGDLGYAHPSIAEYALSPCTTLKVFGAATGKTLIWHTEPSVALRFLCQKSETENQ
jgi:hypothetical protein